MNKYLYLFFTYSPYGIHDVHGWIKKKRKYSHIQPSRACFHVFFFRTRSTILEIEAGVPQRITVHSRMDTVMESIKNNWIISF